ncbi:ABC transporter permease [Kineosphaera limosa]|uniref:ABC transporter permease n=1 Tax=Kineosphaera limosa TaxID=111564 RepID=UPI000A2F0D5D|nr:ABC transporter permease [Kineosphaera limosa]
MSVSSPTSAERLTSGPGAPGRRSRRWRRVGRLVRTRLLVFVPVIALVSAATFWLASRSPFDPLAAYLGDRFERTSVEQRASLAEQLGINDAWYAVWWRWVGDVVVRGDLGQSRSLARPVADVLAQRLPWTLLLGGAGLTIAVVASLVLGVLAARRPGSLLDRFAGGLAYVLQGVPPFVVALVGIAVLSLGLGWLPVAGVATGGADPTWGSIARHLVLPACVLGLSLMPWLLLNVRTSMVAALREDHVQAARARGLPERIVVWRHALPAALLPFVTVVGARLPEVVTGALLVETVFSWPGLAAATVDAATSMDFPLLAAVTVLTCAAVLLGSLLADALYLLLDPRVDHA